MTWRRLLFYTVFYVAFIPLWALFLCGYLGEGLQRQVERLERWSQE